jgi:hypothetical protein
MEHTLPKRTIIDDVVQLAIPPEESKDKARAGKRREGDSMGRGN